ncbi:hypothetical protein CF150_13968 [Pseudomonas sp. CF150]|nr:hypothetical protein CF150_13968 [Pseudomonas sp. CF150]
MKLSFYVRTEHSFIRWKNNDLAIIVLDNTWKRIFTYYKLAQVAGECDTCFQVNLNMLLPRWFNPTSIKPNPDSIADYISGLFGKAQNNEPDESSLKITSTNRNNFAYSN